MNSDPGDLDGSEGLAVDDLDLLTRRLQDNEFIGWQFEMFDLNGDAAIDANDLRFWVEDLKQTSFGDANLDGEVNFPDFLALSANFGGSGGWSQGDFDIDGAVLFADFLVLSSNFGLGGEVAPVPEPNSPMLLGIALLFLTRRPSSKQAAHASATP